MSNKKIQDLNILDQELRKAFPVGMCDNHTRIKIELLHGFELFNTRPYHNHETWSDGYRVTDEEAHVSYEAEDLDDAVHGLIKRVKERK